MNEISRAALQAAFELLLTLFSLFAICWGVLALLGAPFPVCLPLALGALVTAIAATPVYLHLLRS